MTFDANKKSIIIRAFACFMVLSSILLVGARASREAKTLTSRHVSDILMPLAELATEGGGRFGGCHTKAQASHAEMLLKYVDHMNSRHVPLLIHLLPFSKDSIVKRLRKVAKKLEDGVPSGNDKVAQEQASRNIEEAAESIGQLLTESRLLTAEPITTFEPEAMSEEMQAAIRNSLVEAHQKADIYIKNPNLANGEQACMTNRRAIVYLYLTRFGYQEIVGEEELKRFRTDINRTLYQNRLLLQSDAMIAGKGTEGSDYSMLEQHSASERRRLRLLQAIIDNDLQEAQVLLQIAISTAMSDNQSPAVTP